MDKEQVAEQVINEEDLTGLTDDDLVPGRLITVGQIKKWRKEHPNSRIIYFEHFDKPFVIRSYQYCDLEKYNNLMASLEQIEQKKSQDALRSSNPSATEEQLQQAAQSAVIPPKIQNAHFLEMVVLFPEKLNEQLMNGTIDAGLPQTILDIAHKGSGFATVDADIVTEEV